MINAQNRSAYSIGSSHQPSIMKQAQPMSTGIDQYAKRLEQISLLIDRVLSNHLLNTRIIALTQLIVCGMLIVDVFFAYHKMQVPWSIHNDFPIGIFVATMVIALMLLVGSFVKASPNFVFATTISNVSVSFIIDLVGAGYFMYYGNLWQTTEMVCGKQNESLCKDEVWDIRIDAEVWLYRMFVFQVTKMVSMHPNISHLIALLSARSNKVRHV